MNPNNLPKCKCGATTGLSTQGDRVRCSSCLWNEIKRLQTIIGKIPKDADGDPIEDCRSYFFPCANGSLEFIAYFGPRAGFDGPSPYPWEKVHKTREAVEAARGA